MKRVFTRQSLALALTFAVSAQGYQANPAMASVWNPMHWFSGNPSSPVKTSDAKPSKSAQKALQKAEVAQREAEKALQEATLAKERAEKVREAAEALTKQSTSQTRYSSQSTSQDTSSTEENSTSAPQASNASQVYHASSSQPSSSEASNKGSLWNPMNWMHTQQQAKQEKAAKQLEKEMIESAESAHPKRVMPSERVQATTAPSTTKSDSSKNSSPWNPISWFGGDNKQTAPSESTAPKAEQAAPKSRTAAVMQAAERSPGEESLTPDAKTKAAIIETEKGNIAIEFYPDQAPLTVANFMKLADQGFYNKFNMKFHRVIPGFVVQTGDPTGTGAGGAKENIPLEAKNKLSHNAKGVVAMARGIDPNSASSQFYITLAPQTSLDGKYAIFGKVISGMDVLDKIEKGTMLYGVRLVDINTVVRDAQPEKKKFFSSLL